MFRVIANSLFLGGLIGALRATRPNQAILGCRCNNLERMVYNGEECIKNLGKKV